MTFFHSDTLEFLEQLSLHNSTEWFHENRDRYDEVRKQFKDSVQLLIKKLALTDHQLQETTASQSMFRINRDTRFSKNKSPYKTNFGASIAQGGKKSPYASYYLHIAPGNHSFIGGGVYRPSPSVTEKVRSEYLQTGKEFTRIISEKPFIKLFGSVQGRIVKTYPRGYHTHKDHYAIDLIRMKDRYVIHPLQDKQLFAVDIQEKILSRFQNITPFVHYLNTAIDKH